MTSMSKMTFKKFTVVAPYMHKCKKNTRHVNTFFVKFTINATVVFTFLNLLFRFPFFFSFQDESEIAMKEGNT